MLNQDQLNKLQKIKDAYKTGAIKNDKDYLNMLTDFLNDEAPDEVREAYFNDEETDATRQYEREIFADTPWATSDNSAINNGEKFDTKILFNDLPEFYQHDIVKNLIGSDDYDDEDFNEYMSVLSERNVPFGGFSLDFAKKYGIKPYEEGFADTNILEDNGSGEGITPDKVDVNGDGDTDVTVVDANKNGKPDTAIVTADSKAEEKEAVKAAKESLGFDKNDKTSIGKTKGELEDDATVISDKKKKNMTCSDVTQKNILSALIDRRF